MFVCLECGRLFEEPAVWEEKHGLDYGPYELWSGCPLCHGGYTETYRCDCCDEFITGDYIMVDDKRYCSDCCVSMTIGEE